MSEKQNNSGNPENLTQDEQKKIDDRKFIDDLKDSWLNKINEGKLPVMDIENPQLIEFRSELLEYRNKLLKIYVDNQYDKIAKSNKANIFLSFYWEAMNSFIITTPLPWDNTDLIAERSYNMAQSMVNELIKRGF